MEAVSSERIKPEQSCVIVLDADFDTRYPGAVSAIGIGFHPNTLKSIVRIAAIVRPRNGKPSVTNGRFAETKVQIGAFFIIEARDLNEAIRVASIHPAAHQDEHLGWCIEVRACDMVEQS
jgi:hypothetical protein